MYEFDNCEIYGKTGEKLAYGTVMECENCVLKVAVANETGLEKGQTVDIFIFNSFLGECGYEGLVGETRPKEAIFTRLKSTGSRQRRENTRASCHIRSAIYSKIENGEEIPFEKPLEISILNISAQGLYFSCMENLPVGFMFPLDFSETMPTIHLTVCTVRREDGGRGFRYGCSLNIGRREMDRLYRYVLQKQIEQRRNRMRY
ncbi:MAG: PilZ domain-containing protein [Clostridia bacterium]|nr:PilZ domain-containing protein [Clostridia bacterium]MDR3644359.1 PilZ domain-containing protein [Clostridia bacterium]